MLHGTVTVLILNFHKPYLYRTLLGGQGSFVESLRFNLRTVHDAPCWTSSFYVFLLLLINKQ